MQNLTRLLKQVYSQGDAKWAGAPAELSNIGENIVFAEPVKAEDGGYTIDVSGTLKKVVGFTGFNQSVKEEQHGYYAPCQFSVGAADGTAFVVLKAKEGYKVYSNSDTLDETAIREAVGAQDSDQIRSFKLGDVLDQDGNEKVFSLISHLGDGELSPKTIWIGLDGADDLKKYTFNYTNCAKWEPALDFTMINGSNFKEIVGSDTFAGVTKDNVASFVGGDTITFEQVDSSIYNIEGTLKYVKWDGFGVDEQKEGYYIPFAVKVPEAYKGKGKMVFKQTEDSPEKTVELNSSNDDKYFGWITFIGKDAATLQKTRTVEITWGSDSDVLTSTYTFNFKMQGTGNADDATTIGEQNGQQSNQANSEQENQAAQQEQHTTSETTTEN